MYNLAEQTQTELISLLKERYDSFMENLKIKDNGLLGKISNSRYRDHKLRFSGMPYIGSKYTMAKKKILFVGLDIGIDECRESNSFHDFDSRRQCIAGSIAGCTTLGYNDHISGTYAMALYLLQKHYSWEEEWKKLSNINGQTLKTAIYKLIDILPNNVLDYVALTNIHKFVSVCRGCDSTRKKPECWQNECVDEKKDINRTGSNNRKWYNKNEEIQMLLDEIKILEPDLVYFQGSASRLDKDVILEINKVCDICIAYHPSAWNVGANKAQYASQIKIHPKIG